MKNYKVIAPMVVFAIKGDDGKTKEYILKKGDSAELPENSSTVKLFVQRKQIVEIKEDSNENETNSKPSKK